MIEKRAGQIASTSMYLSPTVRRGRIGHLHGNNIHAYGYAPPIHSRQGCQTIDGLNGLLCALKADQPTL